MAHFANTAFEIVRKAIPKGCRYVNVYQRALPRLRGWDEPRLETLIAFHDDALAAELALDQAQRGDFCAGACFGHEAGAWQVMDAFDSEEFG